MPALFPEGEKEVQRMVIRIGKKKFPLNQEGTLYICIAGFIIQPLFFFLLSTATNVFSFPSTVFTYIYYGGLLFLLLLSIPAIRKSINRSVLVGILCAAAVISLQCLFFPQNKQYITGFDPMALFSFQPQSLLTVLPFLLIGLAVKNAERLLDVLRIAARIGIGLGVLAYGLTIGFGMELRYDDMSNAYGLCLLLCILIIHQKLGDILFIIAGILCLVLAGTRGPLVCLVIAVAVKRILLEKNFYKRALSLIVGGVVIGLLGSGLLVWLLEFLADSFAKVGITDLRIINYMRDGMLTDSSGRDGLTATAIEKLFEHPFIGYGVGGDRLIMSSGMYVHNIFIELLLSFGIIGGTAFIMWLAFWVWRAFQSNKPAVRMLAAILLSGIVMKLVFSSSYLYSKELFVFLGVCISGACKRCNQVDSKKEEY